MFMYKEKYTKLKKFPVEYVSGWPKIAVPCWALAAIWKSIFPMSLSAFEYIIYCMWLPDFTKNFKLV